MSCENLTWFLFIISITLGKLVNASTTNLSCYQCIKNIDEECVSEDLRPCPLVSDRCVTHISKNADTGFTIKRECGLGPCGFQDLMANKGLGMDTCDQSSDEYFCVFCCKGNGCNRNSALLHKPSTILMIVLTLILLTIYNRFQPPYILEGYDNV